jgi:GNAT superfamily N-acetyltransferase
LRSREAEWSAEAEIAFSVERAWQGRGIGTALMEAVIAAARARGIQRLALSYNSLNHRMGALARCVATSVECIDEECIANVDVQAADVAAA